MRRSPLQSEFEAFCQRFVRNYWESIAENRFPLPGSEPCEQSLEELLAEIEYRCFTETSHHQHCTLQMTHRSGDEWFFTFHLKRGKWVIASAISTSPNGHRVDWLDEIYSQWFVPLLDRLVSCSQ